MDFSPTCVEELFTCIGNLVVNESDNTKHLVLENLSDNLEKVFSDYTYINSNNYGKIVDKQSITFSFSQKNFAMALGNFD